MSFQAYTINSILYILSIVTENGKTIQQCCNDVTFVVEAIEVDVI